MTDRDRLIELVKKANEKWFDNTILGINPYEFVADHLLANGVIVPPCRCKDCTYCRESESTNRIFCTYHGDDYEFETLPNHYCSEGVGMVKGA